MSDDAARVRIGAHGYRIVVGHVVRAPIFVKRRGSCETQPGPKFGTTATSCESKDRRSSAGTRAAPPAGVGTVGVRRCIVRAHAMIGVRNGSVVARTEDGRLVALDQRQLFAAVTSSVQSDKSG